MSLHEFSIDGHTDVTVQFAYDAYTDESSWEIQAVWSSLPDPDFEGPAFKGLPEDRLTLPGEHDPQAGLHWARTLAEATVR